MEQNLSDHQPSVLHVTTGFPRTQGDVFGSFIADTLLTLSKRLPITVLAPGDHHAPQFENNGQLSVFRFPYWPFGQSRVAYGQGIPTNLKSWACRFQLPFFLMAFAWHIFKESKGKDLIHAHWGISGVLAYFSSRIRGIPLVVSYHGSDLHGQALIRRASKWIATQSHANICISKEQIDCLGTPSHLISYPLDTERFSPVSIEKANSLKSAWSLPSDQPLILMVGYLIPLKKFDIAINAISIMDQGHLIIAGDGGEKQALEALVKNLNLKDRVTFLGSVPFHKIHELFQLSDLHFLCSEREGKPNVIFQAMATGLPSLSTAIGGVPEQIDDNISGRLLPPEATSFARASQELLQDPNLKNKMGWQARSKLENLGIDPQTISQQIEEVYRNILDHPPSTSDQ